MNGAQCLITGCEFLDPVKRMRIHGDLHQLMNVLIFNANGCEWESAEENPLGADEKAVMCPVFYEKNKQIVFPLEMAQFNLAANVYLNDEMDQQKKVAQLRKSIHGGFNGKGH